MDEEKLHQIAQESLDTPITHQFPPEVEDRVLICDADGLAYKACDIDYSYGDNVTVLRDLIETWRKLGGATVIELHLTMGNKGGRENVATVKPYQGNRQVDPAKKDRVNDLKGWMAEYSNHKVIPAPQYIQEADDSMTQAMWEDREVGNCVLMSPDKDLWMVGGKHLNVKTLEIEKFPWDYGSCYTTVSPTGSKKLLGKGTSFFWHQMLMGDAADNIPGLPEVSPTIWLKYAPTKVILNIQRKISSGRMPSGKPCTAEQKRTALRQYNDATANAQPKKVGPNMAFKILENCINDRMAYQRVEECYQDFYGSHAYDMMLEQGRLLWMRRIENQDVASWWREIKN